MMDFLFTLKENIDRNIMEKAMQGCMKRYPYFSFRIIKTDKGLDKVENPLPVTVRDSINQEVVLGSSLVNYHWIAAACEGKVLRLSMSHLMADGRSALWFYKTLLWCYLTERYQITLDSIGIRFPESSVLPDEDMKAKTILEVEEALSRLLKKNTPLLVERNWALKSITQAGTSVSAGRGGSIVADMLRRFRDFSRKMEFPVMCQVHIKCLVRNFRSGN